MTERRRPCIVLLPLPLGLIYFGSTPSVSARSSSHRRVSVLVAISRVCRQCAGRGPGRDCPPPDALPEVPPPSRTPFPGARAAALGAGGSRIEAQEPVPVEKYPDRQHILPGPERLGSSKCRSALTKPEPGRRFVPGGRFNPVMDAGGRNY
jgi:hypothetical protein